MIVEPKPIMPMTSSVPLPVPAAAVPVSLASMDSAVVMVHQQVPTHFYMAGNAGPQLYAHAPLVTPTSMSMVHAPSMPSSEIVCLPNEPVAAEVPSQAAATTATTAQSDNNQEMSSSTWAEEPGDDTPPFQDQARNESNTWTNSNYRPKDQGFPRAALNCFVNFKLGFCHQSFLIEIKLH